jgi:hypothetical protein
MPNPHSAVPHHVLGYLARYTHRVAITNHRLVAFTNNQVTFRWRDYAHGNRKRMMTVEAPEFLRRFLLHVRLRSHPFLWLPGQPSPRHPLIALSTIIVGPPPAHHPNFPHSPSPRMLPLSAMCHPHAPSGISFSLGRYPTPAPEDSA